jgi:hypothetical protein
MYYIIPTFLSPISETPKSCPIATALVKKKIHSSSIIIENFKISVSTSKHHSGFYEKRHMPHHT